MLERIYDRFNDRFSLRQKAAIVAFVIYSLFVAPVNLAVRWLGGYPFLLSPFHYGDKLRAIGSFALHWPRDIIFDHGDAKEVIERAAKRHRVPPALAIAVAHTESRMTPHRVSHAGAMGIMQLMPDTASQLRVSDPFDTEENIDGGVRYLGELWRRYRGDCARVVAAYNAGPGSVPRTGSFEVPAETSVYVRKVLGTAPCRRPTPSSKRRS